MAPLDISLGSVAGAGGAADNASTLPTECYLILSAERRVLSLSRPLMTALRGRGGAGDDLATLLPALARRLPADLTPQSAGSLADPPLIAELTLSPAELVDCPPFAGGSLHVRVVSLDGRLSPTAAFLVCLRRAPPPRELASDVCRALALGLRAGPLERIAAALTHDLSNTFQALLGSLWLLEESGPGSPRASSLLSTEIAAAKQGADLVRQQRDLFRRRAEPPRSLATLFRESEPGLRRLLGPDAQLRFPSLRVAERCLVDHGLGRPLLFLLCHFLGTQATEPVELDLYARVVEDPAQGASPRLQLTLRSNLKSLLPTLEAPTFLHPLWAAEILAHELGVSLAYDPRAATASFELLFPLSAADAAVAQPWLSPPRALSPGSGVQPPISDPPLRPAVPAEHSEQP
jgi:hypothetical protein